MIGYRTASLSGSDCFVTAGLQSYSLEMYAQPNSYNRRSAATCTAEDVANLLTGGVKHRTQSDYVYQQKDGLYSGPRSGMYDESGSENELENIDPGEDLEYQYTTPPQSRVYKKVCNSRTPVDDLDIERDRQYNTTRTPLSRVQRTKGTPRTPTSSQSTPSVYALIQQQQQLLQTLIEKQTSFQEKQTLFEKKLNEMSETAHSQSPSTTDSEKGSKRLRIKRDLSRKVSVLYESLEEGFKESEGSTSEFNAALKRKLIHEVFKSCDSKYTEEEVKAAVQRRYESVRRQWKLEENFGHDCVKMNKKMAIARKYRARRKRKFESRSLVVTPQEMAKWKGVTLDDMSEESDDPENVNNFIVHKFPWCSEEFIKMKADLDLRYLEKNKKESVLVAKKTRTEGTPSTAVPRSAAPQWITKSDWTSRI